MSNFSNKSDDKNMSERCVRFYKQFLLTHSASYGHARTVYYFAHILSCHHSVLRELIIESDKD